MTWSQQLKSPAGELTLKVHSPELPETIRPTGLTAAGLRLESSVDIPVGAELPLTVEVGSQKVDARGRCTWCVWQTDGGYRAGLEFRDLSPELEGLLRHLMR